MSESLRARRERLRQKSAQASVLNAFGGEHATAADLDKFSQKKLVADEIKEDSVEEDLPTSLHASKKQVVVEEEEMVEDCAVEEDMVLESAPGGGGNLFSQAPGDFDDDDDEDGADEDDNDEDDEEEEPESEEEKVVEKKPAQKPAKITQPKDKRAMTEVEVEMTEAAPSSSRVDNVCYAQSGRVMLITQNLLAGNLAVIVDIIDQRKALCDVYRADGEEIVDVARTPIAFRNIRVTRLLVNGVTPQSSRRDVRTAMKEQEVLKAYQNTKYYQNLLMERRRANLTDFERFKAGYLLKMRDAVITKKAKTMNSRNSKQLKKDLKAQMLASRKAPKRYNSKSKKPKKSGKK